MLFPFALLFVSSVLHSPTGARKFLIFLSVYSAVVLGFRGFNQSVRKGERLLDYAKKSGALCRVTPEGWGIAWCKNQWIFMPGLDWWKFKKPTHTLRQFGDKTFNPNPTPMCLVS
jgi:hypothetical protein